MHQVSAAIHCPAAETQTSLRRFPPKAFKAPAAPKEAQN